jgi:hypothetical protein
MLKKGTLLRVYNLLYSLKAQTLSCELKAQTLSHIFTLEKILFLYFNIDIGFAEILGFFRENKTSLIKA